MPYVTDKVKYWMTPSEAVAHVCKVDQCSAEDAKRDILLALTDNNIDTRWGDVEPIGYHDNGQPDFRGDYPIYGGNQYHWNDTIIYWEDGTTYDPHIENENAGRQSDARRAGNNNPVLLNELRPLLLCRKNVESIWKLEATPSAISDANKSSKQPAFSTGLPGKPTSWHLVDPEVRRRWQSGKNHGLNTTQWAEDMHKWILENHPAAPIPTIKTLKNKLTGLLRELRAAPSNQ